MAFDENYQWTILATDSDGNPANLKVDASGNLLIELFSGPDAGTQREEIDENRWHTEEATDSNGVIAALQADTNGYLIIDTTGLTLV